MRTSKLVTCLLVVVLLVGNALSVAAQQGSPGEGRGDGAIAAAIAAAAEETGLDRAEILSQLNDGATLSEIVVAAGGDVQVVLDAALAALTERLDTAVGDGLLSPARAGVILGDLEDTVAAALDGDWSPRQGLRLGLGAGSRGGRVLRGVDGFGFDPLPGRRLNFSRDLIGELGLDATALATELRAGGSFADAITAAGGEPETVIETLMASVEQRLARAVENGRITQANADAYLADLEARLTAWLQTSPLPNRLMMQLVPGAVQLAADELDMTPREVRAALANGSTLAQLLEEGGEDVTAFVDTLVARAEARLNVRVVDGQMTPEQAEAALADIRADIEAHVNGTSGASDAAEIDV